ncbi:MAG: N-acetyltransferase [Henriciella sp.]
MQFQSGQGIETREISDLFRRTFTASEGAKEGEVIAKLAANMHTTTPADDLYVFTAMGETAMAGCIFFSRIAYSGEPRTVFILSPVAVAPGYQRRGIGQGLLRFGLEALQSAGVDIAMTYGDPAYYAQVGFKPISETIAQPPFPLEQPRGWLAQSLGPHPVGDIKGYATCAPALNDPAYW